MQISDASTCIITKASAHIIRYLMEAEDKTYKKKTKGLHMEMLKAGVLHK